MTETTALLRVIHFDLAAICNFLAVQHDKSDVICGKHVEAASYAIARADEYYRLADELEEAE